VPQGPHHRGDWTPLNTYEMLLWLHVLFAILWVGGNVMLNLVAVRARTSGDSTQLASLFRTLAWFGGRYFMPVSLLTLVFGFWIAAEGGWSYSDNPWSSFPWRSTPCAFLIGCCSSARKQAHREAARYDPAPETRTRGSE